MYIACCFISISFSFLLLSAGAPTANAVITLINPNAKIDESIFKNISISYNSIYYFVVNY